jgi:DNA-binding NtrC family response regulator
MQGGGATPLRILVIDDDGRVRAALSQTIALESDLILLAALADASAALAWAESAGPSVALVDMVLSDGATSLTLVRQLAERPGCAVVAMSVHSGLRSAALAAGAAAFVEKSGDIDAVLNAVRRAASTLRA